MSHYAAPFPCFLERISAKKRRREGERGVPPAQADSLYGEGLREAVLQLADQLCLVKEDVCNPEGEARGAF